MPCAGGKNRSKYDMRRAISGNSCLRLMTSTLLQIASIARAFSAQTLPPAPADMASFRPSPDEAEPPDGFDSAADQLEHRVLR